jgi:hypothetical protein
MTRDVDKPVEFERPNEGLVEDAAMPYPAAPAEGPPRSEIEAVRQRHERDLLAIDGVIGIALGRGPTGEDALVLYLRDESVTSRVPSEIEGHPVTTVVTGTIDAYNSAS